MADDEPDVTVTVDAPADDAPAADVDVATVIVPENNDDSISPTDLDLAQRVTRLEMENEELRTKVFAAQAAADVAQASAEVVAEITEDVAEEIPDVAAGVAADVVEDTEIVEDEDGEQFLDAPDPSPRSSSAHWLFADHPIRDRRHD